MKPANCSVNLSVSRDPPALGVPTPLYMMLVMAVGQGLFGMMMSYSLLKDESSLPLGVRTVAMHCQQTMMSIGLISICLGGVLLNVMLAVNRLAKKVAQMESQESAPRTS